MERSLLDRTAVLMSKDDGERTRTLIELRDALDPSNLQANKTRSRAVLDNKAVMDALLNLVATTRSASVVGGALWVLVLLGRNVVNAKRRLREHPSLVPVAMRKLELGAENATEQVQMGTLAMLSSLALDVLDAREMTTKNPKLVPLLVAKVESSSEQMQALVLNMLTRFAFDSETRRGMVTMNPTLVPLLVAQMKSKAKQVQVEVLGLLQKLTFNADNAREMLTKESKVLPMLMTKVEAPLEQVQVDAWGVLNTLALSMDNAAEMMVAHSAVILPLLVTKMNGVGAFPATRLTYNLSCSPANRAALRGNNLVVAALTKGRKSQNDAVCIFSLLTLVNLCGAEEDSKVLKTNLKMLERMCDLIENALDGGSWRLNNPLLAFRYLCVVERNRQLLWDEYEEEFLIYMLKALQEAAYEKDTPAVVNAMFTLAQFSNDPQALAWMRSNKPRLNEAIGQLMPFPEALWTAQCLQLTLDPPQVMAAPILVAGSKPTIFISYDWAYQAQARLIHAVLESQGYPVWRDELDIEEDIEEATAEAVSKSTVALVLVSPSYKECVRCRMECQFAHRNNRKLIPVLVEPGYKADGWLGVLLGGKLYYDVSGFHSEAQMESVVLGMLWSEVEGGEGAAPSIATTPKQPAATSKQPVPQNEAEVRQWLSKHEHGKEIADWLVKEDLVEDLKAMSDLSPSELMTVINFNEKQAHSLHAALKELF